MNVLYPASSYFTAASMNSLRSLQYSSGLCDMPCLSKSGRTKQRSPKGREGDRRRVRFGRSRLQVGNDNPVAIIIHMFTSLSMVPHANGVGRWHASTAHKKTRQQRQRVRFFDNRFLGYDFNATGLVGVAPTTYERFVKRVNRLYEQGASARCIGDYIRRWMVWVVSGLGDWVKTLSWPVYVFDANHNPTIPTLPLVPT